MHKADPSELDPTHAPSVFDIDVLRVARVYAGALLKAGIAKNKVDEFQSSFDALLGNPLARVEGQNDPAALLASSDIPRQKRDDLIRKLFDGKADELFVNFLMVLSDHDRMTLLRPVAAMYRQLRDEHAKRVRMMVRSAVPLVDAQRKQLAELSRAKFQKEAELVEIIDPDLLGGLQIQVGDHLMDYSVKARLESIKSQMIERSSHEIQRRRDRVGSEV